MELISDHAFSPRPNVIYPFLFYKYVHGNCPEELSSMLPDLYEFNRSSIFREMLEIFTVFLWNILQWQSLSSIFIILVLLLSSLTNRILLFSYSLILSSLLSFSGFIILVGVKYFKINGKSLCGKEWCLIYEKYLNKFNPNFYICFM